MTVLLYIAPGFTAQHPHKHHFSQPFRKGHYRPKGVRRWPAYEDAHPQVVALFQSGMVMNAYASMNLIMHPDLLVGYIFVAPQLNAVHTDIRLHGTRRIWVLGIHLWQGNKRATVIGPRFDLR